MLWVQSHTTSIAHEITELRQKKIMSMNERMMEMNDRMTKLEQGRNKPTSKSASLALSYADIVGITREPYIFIFIFFCWI